MATIAAIASDNDTLDILVAALGFIDGELDTDLLGTLSDPAQDLTVFAPTDAAFGQLATDLGFTGDAADEGAVTTFLVGLGAELLRDVVLYHVSPGAKTAAELSGLEDITTLNGATIGQALPRLEDNEPDIIDPAVTAADVVADNGIVHLIDRVLLPVDLEGNDVPTLLGTVAASGATPDNDTSDFDLLGVAAGLAELGGVLDDPSVDLTVFAPTDAAFVGLATALGFDGAADDEAGALSFLVEALTLLSGGADPIPLLTDILTFHVAPESLTSEQVLASTTIDTVLGAPLGIDGTTLVDNDPDIADPNIVALDIQASNGIVHAIDGVLLPVDVLASTGAGDVDFLVLGDADDDVSTGPDTDLIDGNGGNDDIVAGPGADIVLGGSGDDEIRGKNGADLILGQEGNDEIRGGKGSDTIDGGHGSDEIRGGRGNDEIDGSGGRDEINGARGADVIYGGAKRDEIAGGRGADTFVFDRDSDRDVITDFGRGADVLDVTAFEFASLGAVRATATEHGDAVVLRLADDVVVRLEDTDLGDLTRDTVLF